MVEDGSVPLVGEIWKLVPGVGPDVDNRLVLVVAPSHPGLVQVVPLHPYTEYACPQDLVVPSQVSGLSYALVAHGDMRCTAPVGLLVKRLASIPVSTVKLCCSPEVATPEPFWRGVTLVGALDARLDFKRSELATLWWKHIP